MTLKATRTSSGLSQAQLAELAGTSQAQIQRLEAGGRKLTKEWAERLAPHLGTTAQALMFPEPAATEGVTRARGWNAVYVDGVVQAGVFREVEDLDDLGETIPAPRDREFPFARQIAYQAAGDSMNASKPKPINDGDYLIGLAFEDLDLEPTTGMTVVAEQTTADGQLRERSVKVLHVFDDRIELRPESTDPKFKPIVVKRDLTADDGRTVRILALVRLVFDNKPIPVPR